MGAVPRDLLPQIRGGKHYGCYYKMERSNLSTNEPGKSAQHVTFVPMFIHVQSQPKVAPCSWKLDHDCMSVRKRHISFCRKRLKKNRKAPKRQIYHTLSATWEVKNHSKPISSPTLPQTPQPSTAQTAQTKRRCLRHVRLEVPELFDAIRR